MRYVYPAVFTENELGGYSVQFADFPNGYTDGSDMDDAADMAAEVLWLLIDEHLKQGRPLPKPTYDVPGEGRLVAVSVDVDAGTALVSTRAAAEMLGVSSARVRQMIGSGQLAAKKRGRDNYVYVWSINDRLAASRPAGRPKAKTLACGS